MCQTPIKPAIEQLRVDRVKQQLVDSGIPEIGTSVGRGRERREQERLDSHTRTHGILVFVCSSR